MSRSQLPKDITTRVEDYARDTNLAWTTSALLSQREEVLNRWLDMAAAQPFHHDRREHAIADHIPDLFDALIEFMQRSGPQSADPGAPLQDAGVHRAAQEHALVRADQGLQPVDVLVEFRLLRQEVGRALRVAVPDGAPTSDIVGAELLLNDALDGAAALALAALTTRLDQFREEFLATTIHEVGQPITRISGFTQLAERLLDAPTPDLPRIKATLHPIREATEEMGRLLTALMDVSRTALGSLVVHPENIDLLALIQKVLAQLEPHIASRVTVEMPGDTALDGRWDADRLAQVLRNLLSNAAKYSPPNTPITVAIQRAAETVLVSVRDEGMGIPPTDLPRLFGRYVRAHNAQDTEGLGLGLYLCRGIVEAHGGHIWATSAGAEQGTTISFELPWKQREQSSAKDPPQSPTATCDVPRSASRCGSSWLAGENEARIQTSMTARQEADGT